MNYFDTNPAVIQWASEEIIIPYICKTDNRPHRYYPDFLVHIQTKSGREQVYLIEVKPESQTKPPRKRKKTKQYVREVLAYTKNVSKWDAAIQYCKEKGWKFMILTEKQLT